MCVYTYVGCRPKAGEMYTHSSDTHHLQGWPLYCRQSKSLSSPIYQMQIQLASVLFECCAASSEKYVMRRNWSVLLPKILGWLSKKGNSEFQIDQSSSAKLSSSPNVIGQFIVQYCVCGLKFMVPT